MAKTQALSEDDWRQKLSPEQYQVLRQKGTEAPFSGKFLYNKKAGRYACAACGSSIFGSDSKYESSQLGLQGWPSFADVLSSEAVELKDDYSWGMHRIEVNCRKCGSHLGHVFDDEDSPSGKHYCVNSVALNFKPKKPNGQNATG